MQNQTRIVIENVQPQLDGGAYCIKRIVGQMTPYLKKTGKSFMNEIAYGAVNYEFMSDQLQHIFKTYPIRFIENKSLELPRSASEMGGQHGTFKDCEKLLPRVAAMGFDTLNFSPIHPIGKNNRKGKNNATNAQNGDVGSLWGIGSKHGGQKVTHPQLGTLADFRSRVKIAKDLGIEISMDYALQAATDHPYAKDFPQWFKCRPDGTVQYAENTPKKYQEDIQPIYFESGDWKQQ